MQQIFQLPQLPQLPPHPLDYGRQRVCFCGCRMSLVVSLSVVNARGDYVPMVSQPRDLDGETNVVIARLTPDSVRTALPQRSSL